MLINYPPKGRAELKIDFNRKYNTIAVYCILTFAVCLALVLVCIGFPTISGYIKTFFKVIAPVTWGVVIAYICNPIMKSFERALTKLLCKKKQHPKLCRYLSVFVSMLLLIAVISLLLTLIIIQVRDSLMEILYSIPAYISQLESLATKFLGDYPEIIEALEAQLETIQPKLMEFANNIIPTLGDLSIKVKDGAIGFVIALKDFIIGFIVAIYLLISKETFIAQARKVMYAIFPKNVGKKRTESFGKNKQYSFGLPFGKAGGLVHNRHDLFYSDENIQLGLRRAYQRYYRRYQYYPVFRSVLRSNTQRAFAAYGCTQASHSICNFYHYSPAGGRKHSRT